MAKQKPILEVRNLTKDYETGAGKVRVLDNVSLKVYPGEIVAIMGPSGSGKSSLLYILGLLQPTTSGSYNVMGQDVFKLSKAGRAEFRRSSVGFVLQSANMFEHSTVYENLEYPLLYARVPASRRKDMILDSLKRVNLTNRAYHPTNRLSGGEQQRVAIARALVNRPRLILGDEPTGQLDSKNSEVVMRYFEMIVSSAKTGMVLVTHDANVAERCSRAYFLEDGHLARMK